MADFPFRPRPTTMLVDDLAVIFQTDPRAFEFISAVQPLKDTKEFVYIYHIKTSSVIANEYDRLRFVAWHTAYFNFCLRTQSGELQGIRDQIDQNNSQHGAITSDYWQVRNLPLNILVLSFRPEFLNYILNQFIKVNLQFEQFIAAHPRELQEVVNESPHLFGQVGKNRYKVLALIVKWHFHSILEKFQKSIEMM